MATAADIVVRILGIVLSPEERARLNTELSARSTSPIPETQRSFALSVEALAESPLRRATPPSFRAILPKDDK